MNDVSNVPSTHNFQFNLSYVGMTLEFDLGNQNWNLKLSGDCHHVKFERSQGMKALTEIVGEKRAIVPCVCLFFQAWKYVSHLS